MYFITDLILLNDFNEIKWNVWKKVFLFHQVLKPDGFMDAVLRVRFENLTQR